jgi:glycosyltransferase involved in cell wall biosynthesis
LGKLKEKGIFFYLDLIGDGDEKQNYIALAKRLNVIDQIEFKGYVPRELMVGAYHLADIFVLPSYNEGMSNALLEAMACGLTPVVTDVGGTSELVNEERNGFVFKAGNSEQLTSILEKIANQPDILDRMGRSSSQLVKQLNWPQVVREYLSVFNEMTKKLK